MTDDAIAELLGLSGGSGHALDRAAHLAPPGLIRIDAVRVPQAVDLSSGIFLGTGHALVRVRSATALGPPVAPFLTIRCGVPEELFFEESTVTFSERPVYAASTRPGSGPLEGLDQSGFRSWSTAPTDVVIGAVANDLAVAGCPLLQARVPPGAGLVGHEPSFAADNDPGTWFGSAALPAAAWRVQTPDTVPGDFSAMDQDLAAVVSPPVVGEPPSSGDAVSTARPHVTEWQPRVSRALASWNGTTPGQLGLADVWIPSESTTPTAPKVPGSTDVTVGAWWSMLNIDPGAAVLLGTLGRVFLPDALYRTVAAFGAFAVPRSAIDPAHRAARQHAANNTPFQNAARAVFQSKFPDLPNITHWLSVRDSDVVFLNTVGIVVPPPDVPRAPVLSALPKALAAPGRTGVEVRGHQHSPVALRTTAPPALGLREQLVLPEPGVAMYDTGPGRVTYQVSAIDIWGRTGAPAFKSTEPLPLPAPSAPSLDLTFTPDATVGTGTGPVSPGAVTVRAFFNEPPDAAAGVTATVTDLAGARSHPMTIETDPHWWRVTVRAEPTSPGQRHEVKASVAATVRGRPVASLQRRVWVADRRPIRVSATSEALLFAGRCRPDGSAEVDVVVSGLPEGKHTYRVYVADEAVALGSTDPDQPRFARVKELRRRATRESYVRVEGSRVTGAGSGRQRIRFALPGRTRGLRAVRLVAVTTGGLEAPWEAESPPFVVAVPLDDVPGTPSLRVVPGDDPRTLEVTVGVTHPRVGDRAPHSLRVRDSAADVALPCRVWWAPAGSSPGVGTPAASWSLDAAPTTASEGIWRWSGTRVLRLPAGVAAYSRLRLWAEVAWPAEHAYDPDVPVALGTVRRTYPAGDGDDWRQPSSWGPSSTAVVVVPPELDPVGLRLTRDAATGDLLVGGLPVCAPSGGLTWTAVASDGDRRRSTPVSGPGPTLRVATTGFTTAPGSWRVSITRPDGRAGPVLGPAQP